MKINIKATNLVLTPAIEKAIEEKIANLDHFISKVDSSVEAWVEVGLVTHHHHKGNIYRAEINIQVPGKILRVEAERKNLNLALTEVKDELQEQLKKYKGRPQALKKRGGRLSKVLSRPSPLAGPKIKKGQRLRQEGL